MAYYGATDLLKKMIEIPSVSRDEKEVADLLENYLKQHTNPVRRKGNNIWALSPDFDYSRPTILLNSHIDTVMPVDSWTKEPFVAEESDDRIYGLGSNDAGASVVSLLHAFLLLTQKTQKYNLIFLASCEEEVSGKNGIESVLPELGKIAFAIVGEPTGMNAAIAEKGLVVIDGTVHGKSGHAARNEGVNAIYEALPLMEKLKNFSFEKLSPLLGPVKVSLTQINAGKQHNVVPDLCSFVVDVRTNECYTNQEAFDIIEEELKKVSGNTIFEIKPRSTRLNSSGINKDHPFVKRVEMTGKELFGSPTLSDQSLIPFESVKIGPGDSSRSHTADEYIKHEEIREAIELYYKLLDGLSLK